MQTRVAVMSIILEDNAHAEEINDILHLYGRYIIGRMGLPYRQKNINIICVAVDAPQDVISAMAGKLGRVRGANIKTAYSNSYFYSLFLKAYAVSLLRNPLIGFLTAE